MAILKLAMRFSVNTDPTYKEWKPLFLLAIELCEATRILPTRNGNGFSRRRSVSRTLRYTDPTYKEWKPVCLQVNCFPRLNTDPTYKEWKLLFQQDILSNLLSIHGSYLQGMETKIIYINFQMIRTHGSYLQGMETMLYDETKLIQ